MAKQRRITIELSEEDYQRLLGETQQRRKLYPDDNLAPRHVAYGLLFWAIDRAERARAEDATKGGRVMPPLAPRPFRQLVARNYRLGLPICTGYRSFAFGLPYRARRRARRKGK